jgi:hypothetical protein
MGKSTALPYFLKSCREILALAQRALRGFADTALQTQKPHLFGVGFLFEA